MLKYHDFRSWFGGAGGFSEEYPPHHKHTRPWWTVTALNPSVLDLLHSISFLWIAKQLSLCIAVLAKTMKSLAARQTLPDGPYCSMEQSNAKLNRCDWKISLKESSLLRSVYSVDGHDRKTDREEMSFIPNICYLLITNMVYRVPGMLLLRGGFLANVSGLKHQWIRQHYWVFWSIWNKLCNCSYQTLPGSRSENEEAKQLISIQSG